MLRLVFTDKAQADLLETWLYVRHPRDAAIAPMRLWSGHAF